ncbi:hypothetical protein C8J56DRAFT_1064364 [Mycena floridula]|nr:hypothetical protein C8J56DRAFT_1064364 [Mycena floridula]
MLAILFSITTTYFCLYVAASFKLMIGALIDNTDLELLGRLEVANSSILRLNLAQQWINGAGNGLLVIPDSNLLQSMLMNIDNIPLELILCIITLALRQMQKEVVAISHHVSGRIILRDGLD